MPCETAETLEPSKIPMTQSIEVNGIPPQPLQVISSDSQISTEYQLSLCSGIRGRERWQLGGLKGNKLLAAALAMALKGEPGVEEAVANPLTGRILVRYSPDQVQASVETLIRRALALNLVMTPEALPPVASKSYLLPVPLLAAELGCSLLKMLLLGGATTPISGMLWAAGVIVVLGLAVRGSITSLG
jgi:hypothetical protein